MDRDRSTPTSSTPGSASASGSRRAPPAAPRDPAAPREADAPARRHGPGRWVLVFFLVASSLAGFGFIYKLYEFFFELTATEGFSFAGVHLVTYVLVAVGFVLLLAHGFIKGHFSDIEQPKYDLLAHERAFDLRDYEDGEEPGR